MLNDLLGSLEAPPMGSVRKPSHGPWVPLLIFAQLEFSTLPATGSEWLFFVLELVDGGDRTTAAVRKKSFQKAKNMSNSKRVISRKVLKQLSKTICFAVVNFRNSGSVREW